MDIRFIAAIMVIAMIMDLLGRMARKRAEQQGRLPGDEPAPGEGAVGESAWDLFGAVAPDAVERPSVVGAVEPEPPAASEALSPSEALAQPAPLAPPAPMEPAPPEPPVRDRAARPIVVRSREPRPAVQDRPERTAARPAAAKAKPTPVGRRRRTSAAPLDDKLGIGTRRGLRRALVAREVLGSPVALRDEDGGARIG